MCLLSSVKLKLFQKLINHSDSYQLGSQMRSLGNLLIQIGILILPMWIWFDFTSKISQWNKVTFGNIFHRKMRLLARLGGIQQALEVKLTRSQTY